MVILKGKPCVNKGACVFCTLHWDNAQKINEEILALNKEILGKIRGLGTLEIYNSGSIFELPIVTLNAVMDILKNNKSIKKVITESHWHYRNSFAKIKSNFGRPDMIIKVGVETFNVKIRENLMKKNMGNASPKEIRKYTNGINLLVGFCGQTKETIKTDIEIAKKMFDLTDISVFDEKYAPDKSLVDKDLSRWFLGEFQDLTKNKRFRVLKDMDTMCL